ncbi:hypothetical protein [uncultured Sneathiella sp.]|uniref:hypothetical protein n=1 Tax=uncultured Sneathiella sp. TaxID=879315 RepID=UPI0025952D08|nr:hypothetical protein [uncultured Sneathiella sp.]
MEFFDYWRLCDDLSIVQAALLIVGEDPSSVHWFVEGLDVDKRPFGYEAAKTALINALKKETIEGYLCFQHEHDINGNVVGDGDEVDISASLISVESLKVFLKARGIKSGFFFPESNDRRNYLDPTNSCYAPKLAAAVAVWENVSSDETRLSGKTPKQAIEKWLREHANEFGLTGTDGNPVAAAIEQISKVTNWKPEGGAAKTPTRPQVSSNLCTPEKNIENQEDDTFDDTEIPF